MKRIIPLLLLCVFSMASYSLRAQSITVKGRVIDSKTKAPLYYTVVNLKGTHIYDLTEEDGTFELKGIKEGRYTMLVSVLGYEPQERVMDIKSSIKGLNIKLNPSSLDLKEVRVTAKASQSKSGSTTYKIGNQAIQQIQPMSVNDILQLVPGNKIGSTDYSQAAQVNLRNVGDEALQNVNSFGTAIIIDNNQLSNDANMQVYNSSLGESGGTSVANKGIDLRDIPASNIESVEVVSGVASAKYGNITSGAVIIKRKAGMTPWRVNLNSTPGSYQTGINKGFRLKSGGFLNADFDYIYSNNNNTSRKKYYQRISSGLRWTREFSKKLSWTNNASFNYGFSFDGDRSDPDEIIEIFSTENRSHNYSLSNTGSLNILGRTNYAISVNYTNQYTNRKSIEDGPIPIIESLTEGTYYTTYSPLSFEMNTELYGAPLNINGRFDTEQIFNTGNIKHNTNIGLEYTYNRNFGKGKVLDNNGSVASITGPGSRETKFNNIPASKTYSLYMQDDINITGENAIYLLKLGARYNYMLEKYHLLSPRISASARFFEKFRIRAAYGISYKAPSMLQLHPAPTYFDLINIGHYANEESRQLAVVTTYIHQPQNEQLDPSRGETFEGGFDYQHKDWSFRLTAFQKKITDGISTHSLLKAYEKEIWEVTQEYPDRQPLVAPSGNSIYVSGKMNTYSNVLDSKTTGLELTASFPKIKATNTRFSLSGSYLRTNSEKTTPTITSSISLSGSQKNRYGVYETPSYTTDVCRSNLTVIQHIPEIKLMVTLIGEANWKYDRHVDKYPSIYPVAYYDKQGNYIDIPQNQRADEQYSDLVKPRVLLQTSPVPSYFNFHLQVRKETKQGHSFSFYANNFLWYTPTYINETSKVREYLNSRVTFGFGMNFKI